MDNIEVTSVDVITGLRGTALIEALERLDPTGPAAGALDVNAIVATIDSKEIGKDDFRRLLAALSRVPSLDLGKVDPAQFANLVSRASKTQLDNVVADRPLRERLLDEIFGRMGSHIRPDRAKNVHAVVHWRLSGGVGDGGYDRYETVISHGSCTVNRDLREKAKATITIGPTDFFKLITHQSTPAVLFVTGKIKVKGDLAFAAGLIGFFDLPKPS